MWEICISPIMFMKNNEIQRLPPVSRVVVTSSVFVFMADFGFLECFGRELRHSKTHHKH